MAAKDDLERRVTRLEARVAANEFDAAALGQKVNALVGGQDVMLGILREHGLLLAGHSIRLDRVEAKLAEHDERFDRIDARFEQMDGKLDIVLSWIRSQP
ncbi:MAG: hypothetical protein ACT4QG_01995 [Sporichthyaceae bacterium]